MAWCWGYDAYGAIGGGPDTGGPNYAPSPVAGARSYTAITAGGNHACAIDTGGTAWCWGRDNWGQVGDGPASQANKDAPVRVADDRSYSPISAGTSFTCALETTGRARCWGSDYRGQVGDGSGSQSDKDLPVPVAGDRAFAAITAGGRHTCALDVAGKGRCWGYDRFGQTGGGPSNQDPKYAPVLVAGDRVYRLPGT